jgi:uncharacterized caspase-like protein
MPSRAFYLAQVFLVAAFVFMMSAQAFSATGRIALVVGNGAYSTVPALPNPPNDARDVAALLKSIGFDVIEGVDLDRGEFVAAVGDFLSRAAGAEAALFYYAGHGVQYQDDNFLLPVDAALSSAYALKADAVSLKSLVAELEAVSPINLIFLDACRDNPLVSTLAAGRSAGQIGRGLARVDPTSANTLIAFAAAPGQVALDGTGRNSPFTSAFLKNVEESDDEVSILFKSIARDVLAETNQAQRPQIVSAMTINFYFQGGAEVTVTDAGSDARHAYEAAERIGTEQAFQAIIEGFPETIQATLAQAAIERLRQTAEEARGLQREEEATAAAANEAATVPVQDGIAGIAATPPDESAIADDESRPAAADQEVGEEAEAAAADPTASEAGGPEEQSVETEVALLSPPEIEAALALSREQRQRVQQALAQLGHDPGPADGAFGRQTRAALSNYQAALSQEETGYLSQDLLNLLEDVPAIAPENPNDARRFALADLPAGTDPRLTKAVEALGSVDLKYGYHEGHLYIAVLTWNETWATSKIKAENAGGHLVTISSEAEN